MIERKVSILKYADCSVDPQVGITVDNVEQNYVACYEDKDGYDFITSDKLQKTLFEKYNIIQDSSQIDPYSLKNIYITKSASLPRYKIRDIKEKYNINVVRDREKADTVVVSNNEIKHIFKRHWTNYYYSKQNMLDFLNEANVGAPKSFLPIGFDWVKNSLAVINELPEDIAFLKLDYRQVNSLRTVFSHFNYDAGQYSTLESVLSSDYITFTSNSDKKVITDSSLQALLGSNTLTYNDYLFIDNLLNNNDKSNVDVGLTMMANCNFTTSKHYLMLLLNDHFNKYYSWGYCKSVSFKSLLSYMEFNRYKHYEYNEILDTADDLSALTDELKELIIKRFLHEGKALFRKYSWIQIGEITVKKPEEKIDDKL